MLDVLLVDDEPTIRLSLGDALRAAGHRLTIAGDGNEALALVSSRVFDVVISDMRLPGAGGMAIFRKVRATAPTTDVILITAYGAVEDAVAALKEGARDYLVKPLDDEEVVVRVARIDERRGLERELAEARRLVAAVAREGSALARLVGTSPLMVRLRERIETIAASDAPVLVTGESGTGKELVARSLRDLGGRRDRPFVAVSCAAFPETLLEAELFGHERGAFTGAIRKREGRFKVADGGTLFLDEVAEIPLPAQAKLLRVLEEGVVEPLGTDTAVPVDVRLVSATHRNLKERIAAGRFREDLYYRLNVLDIHIPPLRDRRGDLPLLAEHFLRRFSTPGAPTPTISARAWAAIAEYPFPGNVRELEHAVQHAVVLARGRAIDLEHLPTDLVAATKPGAGGGTSAFRPLAAAAKDYEREHLLRALALADGRRARAAELLGISRKNLWEKLRAHGISDSDGEE